MSEPTPPLESAPPADSATLSAIPPPPGGVPAAALRALAAGFAGPSTPPPTVPGYGVLGVLGHGGMGVVYTARQLSLNRMVALKMVLTGAHAGPQERARFHAEAEAVARLQHPNIVQIYEVGEAEGQPFLALEFLEGGSLADQFRG